MTTERGLSTVVVRPRCSGFRRALTAALTALMLALASVSPAQAGLIDCVNAAVPVKQGFDASVLAAKVGACASEAASNQVEGIAVATVAALVVAKIIPADSAACESAINSVIGQLIAQALLEAGVNPFGQSLIDLANGVGSVTDVPGLGQMLACACTIAGAPAEAQAIADEYMNSVGACGQFFADVAQAILDAAEDVLCWVFSLFGGCEPAGGGDNTCYSGATCPKFIIKDGAMYQDCGIQGTGGCIHAIDVQCTACGGWGNCNAIPHGIGVVWGKCTCEPPYTGKYSTSQVSGQTSAWLYECDCEPPNVSENGQCLCPSHMQLANGVCIPCKPNEIYDKASHRCEPCANLGTKPDDAHETCVWGCDTSKGEVLVSGGCKTCASDQRLVNPGSLLNYCEDCGSGQTASKDFSSCVPLCPPGRVTMPGFTNPNTGIKMPDTCWTCTANTFARYTSDGSSDGTCAPCADSTSSPEAATTCTALDCGTTGYVDPDNTHACKYCPPGQIYKKTGVRDASGHKDKDLGGARSVVSGAGRCVCPDNTRQVGDVCECPQGSLPSAFAPGAAAAGCACPAGAHLDQASFSCRCPDGANLVDNGTRCACPPGTHVEGDKCVRPVLQAKPVTAKDCSALGPAFINDPKNAAACVRCPRGRVASGDRTTCVPPKAGTGKTGTSKTGTGAVVTPKVNRGDTWLNPQPEPPAPRRSCPPNMTPNLRGTGCVPTLDMPDFGSPGSLPSPAGRGPTSGPAGLGTSPARR